MDNITLHQAHGPEGGPAGGRVGQPEAAQPGPAAAHPAPPERVNAGPVVPAARPAQQEGARAGEVAQAQEAQNAEIARLRQRLAELEGGPPQEDLPELTAYPRTRYLIRNSLDRTLEHMLRNRRLREMRRRPRFVERILNIPILAGLLAPFGRNTLPLGASGVADFYGKINTAGDIARASGAFAASTAGPAVASGLFAALGRAGVDAGKWIVRKYNTVHVLGDEIRRRTENNFSKGKLEFKHLFNDNGDIAQMVDLNHELEAGVSANHLGLHRDEMKRLVKKAVEMRLEKLSLERILPANSRLFIDYDERLKFDDIETAYNAARTMYDQGLDRHQKARLLWEIRQGIQSKDNVKHATLMLKRMGVFALGGAAVGAATSLVKSLSETGLLADWGNRLGSGIKKGVDYAGTALGNLYNSVTSTVGGWLDKINLQNLNFDWLSGGANTAVPATSGAVGLSQATATAKAADLGSAFFPTQKTIFDLAFLNNPQSGQSIAVIIPKTVPVTPVP